MDDLILKNILSNFQISSSPIEVTPLHQGYINDTYLIKIQSDEKFILQKVNQTIFKNIERLHLNFDRAVQQLKGPNYKEIKLIRTRNNTLYCYYKNNCWRLLTYIENSDAFNCTKDIIIAFQAGKILGNFHQLLTNQNLDNFKDTIENLNHLPSKFQNFDMALAKSSIKRKLVAKEQISFALAHASYYDKFYDAHLPPRLCHNDTKLNNMLFDKTSKKGLCLIDLDTIMKGYIHYDFGDAVRTIVSETNEDEIILEKITFNLDLFQKFTQGFMSCKLNLSVKEIQFLPICCSMMPFMHGLRALTDYLNGNIYYKVNYEYQNLDRARSLFEFTRQATLNQGAIKQIIDKELQLL